MRVFWALGIMALTTAAGGGAHAAPSSYSDYIVISVVPRSPNVQPFVMAIPARERQKREASLQAGALMPIADKK